MRLHLSIVGGSEKGSKIGNLKAALRSSAVMKTECLPWPMVPVMALFSSLTVAV